MKKEKKDLFADRDSKNEIEMLLQQNKLKSQESCEFNLTSKIQSHKI